MAEKKIRYCLRCDKRFESWGYYRCCKHCRAINSTIADQNGEMNEKVR